MQLGKKRKKKGRFCVFTQKTIMQAGKNENLGGEVNLHFFPFTTQNFSSARFARRLVSIYKISLWDELS